MSASTSLPISDKARAILEQGDLEYFTAKSASLEVGCSDMTIRRAVKAGKLIADRQEAREWWIHRSALAMWYDHFYSNRESGEAARDEGRVSPRWGEKLKPIVEELIEEALERRGVR